MNAVIFVQRYFLSNDQFQHDTCRVQAQDAHHIRHVMRFSIGDEVIVCNESGVCHQSLIQAFDGPDVLCRLLHPVADNELPVHVDIAQALIRRERFEYMLQKASELGARSILPVAMRHSIVKWDDKKGDQKIDRWNKITKEASEQSHRRIPVTVTDVHTIDTLPVSEYDLVLVADETKAGSPTLPSLLTADIRSILVVIGPEGGFHDSERDWFDRVNHAHRIGLGKRILRSETASAYVLSVLSYVYEMGGLS
jgi:16S rRNA (uracil1498-N3)-methyltransferase